MSSVLVIGYGNTLRGDDAAGVRAAELIVQRVQEIECLCVHQLMPELAENISRTDLVIFFDAQAGCTDLTVRSLAAVPVSLLHTHIVSPEILLTLSRDVYGRLPSQAYAIGIPAFQFDFSEELSPETQQAVLTAADRALEYINQNKISS
jgi:hydrogenase maturation protease